MSVADPTSMTDGALEGACHYLPQYAMINAQASANVVIADNSAQMVTGSQTKVAVCASMIDYLPCEVLGEEDTFS